MYLKSIKYSRTYSTYALKKVQICFKNINLLFFFYSQYFYIFIIFTKYFLIKTGKLSVNCIEIKKNMIY